MTLYRQIGIIEQMKVNKHVKIFWQYLKKHKRVVVFLIVLVIISSILDALIPYIYGRLVDISMNPETALKLIFEILGLWLFLTLIVNWLSRYVGRKSSMIASEASNDFNIEMISHIMNLPIGFHKEKKMGEILQRIGKAREYFSRIIEEIVFSTVPAILEAIIGLVILALVEWRLSVAIVFILLLYGLITIIKTKPIVKSQKILNRAHEKTYGDIYNAVNNIQVVKSSIAERLEGKRNIKNFSNITNKLWRLITIWNKLDVWQQTIIGCGFVFIFAGGIFLLRAGFLSAGTLVMFVGYTNLVFRPFTHIGYYYRMLKTAITTIDRALKLKNIKPEKYGEGTELREIHGKVEFRNVNFAYKKGRVVLKNINFKVKPGEVVALVGSSGVGKSTLIDLISRYNSPTKGSVLIDGRNVEKVNLHSLRKNIAIVPQEVSLFNDTIKNNIAYGRLNAGIRKIIEVSTAANAHEFIIKFPKQYKQRVGERGVKLSVGQKQRVAIARALLRDPKILILDEATSALDSISEKLVQEALKRLIKGRTTFIIAHRLSTIRDADQIFVFNKGQIVERGKHADLMKKKNGIYRKFYMMQSAYQEEKEETNNQENNAEKIPADN